MTNRSLGRVAHCSPNTREASRGLFEGAWNGLHVDGPGPLSPSSRTGGNSDPGFRQFSGPLVAHHQPIEPLESRGSTISTGRRWGRHG